MSEWIPLSDIPVSSQIKVKETLQFYRDQDLKKKKGLSLWYKDGASRIRYYVRRSEEGTLEIMTMERADGEG